MQQPQRFAAVKSECACASQGTIGLLLVDDQEAYARALACAFAAHSEHISLVASMPHPDLTALLALRDSVSVALVNGDLSDKGGFRAVEPAVLVHERPPVAGAVARGHEQTGRDLADVSDSALGLVWHGEPVAYLVRTRRDGGQRAHRPPFGPHLARTRTRNGPVRCEATSNVETANLQVRARITEERRGMPRTLDSPTTSRQTGSARSMQTWVRGLARALDAPGAMVTRSLRTSPLCRAKVGSALSLSAEERRPREPWRKRTHRRDRLPKLSAVSGPRAHGCL